MKHHTDQRHDVSFLEGEQFANAFFDTKTKIAIAKALDAFGVDYIELTSPAASEQSRRGMLYAHTVNPEYMLIRNRFQTARQFANLV